MIPKQQLRKGLRFRYLKTATTQHGRGFEYWSDVCVVTYVGTSTVSFTEPGVSYVQMVYFEYFTKGSPVRVTEGPQPCTRRESPCPACKRMNDVGVKVCWCCGGTLG